MRVSLTNISKSYGNRKVLSDINFTINSGEVVSFLGPNGAGKSTCIKIITGWFPPETGKVTICGYDIEKAPLEAKRQIGYLPENNPLYTELYVREYLEYVAGIYKLTDIRKRIEELGETLKITSVLGKTIGTLSKGYRQRVGLAQALIHDPQVLILDEPFSGLDPNQLEEVHTLIKELGKKKAILFSSHSLQEVKEISNRTIIINKGTIVADDTIDNITEGKSLDEIFRELTR